MPTCRQRSASPSCPPEVSIRIFATLVPDLRRIASASWNPSMPGHACVHQDDGKGCCPSGVLRRWPPVRPAPPSVAQGFIPHPAVISHKIRRLVSLSSTTSTATFCKSSAGAGSRRLESRPAAAQTRREMKRAALALAAFQPDLPFHQVQPGVAEMANPSPVPPYLRVVLLSACEKAWKSSLLFLRRNSDAGVHDLEMQFHLAVVLGLPGRLRSAPLPFR